MNISWSSWASSIWSLVSMKIFLISSGWDVLKLSALLVETLSSISSTPSSVGVSPLASDQATVGADHGQQIVPAAWQTDHHLTGAVDEQDAEALATLEFRNFPQMLPCLVQIFITNSSQNISVLNNSLSLLFVKLCRIDSKVLTAHPWWKVLNIKISPGPRLFKPLQLSLGA